MRVPSVSCLSLALLATVASAAVPPRMPAVRTRPVTPVSVAPAAPKVPARPPRFSLEHLLSLSTFQSVVWSPDGRRLALAVTTPDTAESANNADLWLVDLARGDAPLRLTRHPKADVSPTFSPGGDTLAFVANRGTGDDAKPAIWMLSLRGGEPWPFGTTDEAVGEVAWSPDGRWLAYVKTDTLPKTVREWRKKKWDPVVEDERLQYPHLWVVELATGNRTRLIDGARYCWNVRWSPDSRTLACLVSPTGSADDENLTDLALVPVNGGPVRTVGALAGAFAWSPDGLWLAWAAGGDRAKHVQKTDLWVVSAAGGAPANLTAGFDEDAAAPVWDATSGTLRFWSAQGVTTRLASVARAGGPVTLGLDVRGEAGNLAAGPGGRLAWTQTRDREPVEVRVAEAAGQPGLPVTALNASAAGTTLGTTRAVRWTSSDGVTVEGVLLRPADAPPGAALPTIVQLHGGPYASRYALGFQPGPQFFAAHGWQVFLPNFRSSGGYGTAFLLRERADWGGQDWRDVTSGVDSLVARGLADPKRLVVTGGSYGGYLTAWAITHTDRFRAASVIAGAVELASFFGQSDVHRYRAYEFEGAPWETPEKWAHASPWTTIASARTPTLIQVGENDARVPPPQAQQLYEALRALGVPTEYVHYPREGHGLREPRHRADQYLRQLAWFERWTK